MLEATYIKVTPDFSTFVQAIVFEVAKGREE